jgi:single-strand DNA-binding protein
MFETPIVIVGNVVNDPVHRRVGEQEVFRFRVASNSRRKSAEGIWETADTLYASVSCWGRLVTGTAASLTKGDPVIVVGQVYTSDYEDRDGNPRNSVEVRAHAVGPDLSRSTARIERFRRHGDDQPAESTDAADPAADVDDSDDETEVSDAGLPMTA